MIYLTVFGSFLWRIRGGLLNSITGTANWMGFNDTVVRLIWSAGMAALFALHAPDHAWLASRWSHFGHSWIGLVMVLALALFAGSTVFGWFGAALLPSRWRDVAILTLSGSLRMGFVALALLSPAPLIAGLLCGPAYWLGAKLPAPRQWMFWGEWIFGAVIGAALGVS